VKALALAGVLTVTMPMAAHAGGPSSDMRPNNAGPSPGIVLVWDGSRSSSHVGANGDHSTAGRVDQWNGKRMSPHWRPNRRGWGPYGWRGVPTYWVWGPSGGAFDYPDLLGEWP
jgi:hypothetical protein